MKHLLHKLLGGRGTAQAAEPAVSPAQAPIVVVSGLPRSGTSMMMKMLEAGGLAVAIDGLRAADTDNPEGYYELERVKELDKGDVAWVGEIQGQGVKVISALLEFLPDVYTYQVIFMHRNLQEVLRSQRRMLEHRGEAADTVSDNEIAELFTKHVTKTLTWVRNQPNFTLLEVDYNVMLQDPLPSIRAVNQFLGNRLDEVAMAQVVNPDLYRNRAEPSS